jgi:hypothetical protein
MEMMIRFYQACVIAGAISAIARCLAVAPPALQALAAETRHPD